MSYSDDAPCLADSVAWVLRHEKMKKLFDKPSRAERFDSVMREQVMPMYQAAYRHLQNVEDAEDLVQDILTKLYPRLEEVEGIEALRPWLLRIVYHSFVDFLRKQGRTPMTVEDDTAIDMAPDESSNPELAASNTETANRLNAAVERLPEDQIGRASCRERV